MIRRILSGVLTVAVLISASQSSASASDQTVTQAIKAQDQILHANPTYTSLKGFKINTTAEAKKAIPKYEALQKLLLSATNAVAAASASASQKTGQQDWVSGVRAVSKGIGYFVTELNDLVHGNKAGAKTAATQAAKLLKSGTVTNAKGDRLLGLPSTD